MSTLSPFVYWAQNEGSLFLKIDLKDVKDPDIKVEKETITFNGLGRGAQGSENYSFQLQFFEAINVEEKQIKITDSSISITLTKQKGGWWPRLISTPQKPSWLKIDFDRWQTEDDLIDEKVNDIATDYPDVYKHLMKNELGYVKEEFKAVYMLFYNLGMLSAFLYLAVLLGITLSKHGFDESAYVKVYPSIGRIVCCVCLLQVLEIMHPMFGYVKGNPLMPFIQVFGKLFILFGNLEFEPRLQKMPVTTWLFLAWIYSDVIRYIYYIFHTADSSNNIRKVVYPFFRWLRYSAWIVLYPIGFLCESVIVFRNILYLHNNPRFYLRLPNPYNVTFDYLTFLRIYMLFIMFPGMYTLLKYMYQTRVKNLGGREPFDKINFIRSKSD